MMSSLIEMLLRRSSGRPGLAEHLSGMGAQVSVEQIMGGGPEGFDWPGMDMGMGEDSRLKPDDELEAFDNVRSADSTQALIEKRKAEFAEHVCTEYAQSHTKLLEVARKIQKQRDRIKKRLRRAKEKNEEREYALQMQVRQNAVLNKQISDLTGEIDAVKDRANVHCARQDAANDQWRNALQELVDRAGGVKKSDLTEIMTQIEAAASLTAGEQAEENLE